jgi:hypothetical protein
MKAGENVYRLPQNIKRFAYTEGEIAAGIQKDWIALLVAPFVGRLLLFLPGVKSHLSKNRLRREVDPEPFHNVVSRRSTSRNFCLCFFPLLLPQIHPLN